MLLVNTKICISFPTEARKLRSTIWYNKLTDKASIRFVKHRTRRTVKTLLTDTKFKPHTLATVPIRRTEPFLESHRYLSPVLNTFFSVKASIKHSPPPPLSFELNIFSGSEMRKKVKNTSNEVLFHVSDELTTNYYCTRTMNKHIKIGRDKIPLLPS
jgi:hypothetical protein